jgi:hypothetical protein
VGWLPGDTVLPLSMLEVRGESIDARGRRSKLFVEDSLRSVVVVVVVVVEDVCLFVVLFVGEAMRTGR